MRKRRSSRRISIFLLSVIVIILVFQGLIPISNKDQPDNPQTPPNDPLEASFHDILTGVGYGLNYTEWANRTDTSSLALLYDTTTFRSGSATTTLATSWKGYKMQIRVYQLTQNRTYIDNYNFQNGQTNWVEVEVDTGWDNIQTGGAGDDITILTNSGPGGTGDTCARVQQEGFLNTGYYRFNNLDRAAFRQTITIQGGTVIWAGLDFDYWMQSAAAWPSSMFHAYARVGATEVWAKTYGPLSNPGVWQRQNLISVNTLPFTPSVDVEIGLQCDASVGYSSDPFPRFRFDNVRLYIMTLVVPSAVNLQMNSQVVTDNGVGNGYVTQMPGTMWQTSPLATFTWTTTPNPPVPNLPVIINFKVDANLFALKGGNLLSDLVPGAYGTRYTVTDGANTSWETYSLIATPTGYWNHYLNFTKPVDWNFDGLYQPQNPTVNIISKAIAGKTGQTYIRINLTDITVSPAGYWRFTSKSPNYVTEVTPTLAGTPQSNFRIGQALRVRSTVTNAPTGYANLSIYDPLGGLWRTEVLQPPTNQFNFADITLVGATTPAGQYETVVWWNNRTVIGAANSREAGLRQEFFTVMHATQLQSYDIATIQTDIFTDVLYNETFVLKAKYTDTDNGFGIEGASVKLRWIDSVNYTLTGLGGGFYQIDSLNTGQTPGVYSLTMYASKNYFDSATKQITVELAHHTSLTPNSTSVTVDWGEKIALQFNYNDTDINAGITGASVWVSSGWQTGNWANTSMGSGTYRITFTTTWTIPNTIYEVQVSADRANYQLKTRQVTIFVKARSSELSSLPPPAVPIRDAVNITINFIDRVNGTGISNSTYQLRFIINASLSAYSRIYTISSGVYWLKINTSAPVFTQPGTYTISLAANWIGQPYYANQSISIRLTVRQISTSLTYDPPGDIPYGNIVNLVVHYKVTDTESKFNGLGITGAKINITSPGYTYRTNYTVAAHLTIPGDYIVTIYNNTLKSIAIYSISLKASGLINYANSTIALNINVRKLYTSIVITSVGNVPYGNNVNISLQVTYSDAVSQWYNGRPLTGLTAGNFGITGGHLFNVYNLGSGNYILEVRNGTVLSFRNYREYINLIAGGIYLSDNRSVSWTIRKLVSTIIVDPITDVPYGNKAIATIHVTYDDAASKWWNGRGITGLSTTNFTLSGTYTYAITDLTNGVYRLTIENGTILNLQAYTETLTLKEGGIFQSDTTPVNFNVRSLFTELVADLVPAHPLGEDVTFNVHYRVKDTASSYYNGRGILGARINITSLGYTYGTDYTVSGLGNGDYRILIRTSKVASIQSYTVDLKASYNATYNNATTSSAFQVRAISTSFIYTAPSPAPWGTNVTIALAFSVEDSLSSQNRNPLPGANLITVNTTNPTFLAAWYDLSGGNYQVKLNTASLAMGTYRANITIYKTNYVNRSVIVEFILRAHFTQVTYNIPDPQPWGKNTTMTVFFEDVDFGYSKIRPVLRITVNESQSLAYNWQDNGDGSFTVVLDTRNPTLWPVGSQRVQVKFYRLAYQNSSTTITITMKTRDTDLIYQTPDITPYLQNSVIKICYRDLKNSTASVGINNNTNPQIPGLQTSTGNVSITVTILNSALSPVAGASFRIYNMLAMVGYGNGWYNVTIDTASLGLTGTYYADIVVKWLKRSYYNNQTIRIPFNVRNITALLEYQPPGSTPYVEGGSVSVRLKYSDIDNSLPINNATVTIYYIEDPSNSPLSPFTKALGNYSVVDQGGGWYLVRIYMGLDKLYKFGSYDFSIRFNKTNYDTRSIANITFAIRQGYTQFTSPYAPLSYVINGIVNISINYIDSESGIGIVNKTTGAQVLLKWSWPYNVTLHPEVINIFGWSDLLSRWVKAGDTGNYPMGDDGRYLMQINFTPTPVGNWTLMYLNITAGRNVQSQILNITFFIEPQSSVMGVTFPQPVVWGVESRFNVTYSKVDGSGISGTTLNLWDLDRGQYWNSIYWSFQSINPAIGLFEVTVNTTLHPPPSGGFFRLRVEASGGAYTPRSLNVFLNVRPIDSQVVLTPPAATGWNTLANITIQYYDTYYSRSINDSNINDLNDVILRVTNVPQTYWKLYNGPANGYYIVEINTSYWPTLNQLGHSVYIDVRWEGAPYYNNWTAMRVGVPVRARNTDLSYVPSLQIPYGENASVSFEWRDLEVAGNQGIDNTTQKVLFELRDWLNRRWNSSGFAWINGLGNGQYELRVNSSKLPGVGSYAFTAYFNWLGQPYYSNRSTSFNINVRQINTILIYSIPAPVPWGNSFQILVQLNVSDASSSLNGRYINAATLNISSISDSSGPLSPFTYGINYSVADNGFGRYTLTIFNSTLKIDLYSLTILASRYHINTIYRNASASFSFTVRPLTTTLTYTSSIPEPWGNYVNISLNYKVSDSASLYWNGRNLPVGIWRVTNGTVWTQGVQYSVLGIVGVYIIRIDNKSVYGSNIGTFLFDIIASVGNNRFLNSTLSNLPFTIRALTTALTYLPSTTQPFGNNVTFFINFNVTDPRSSYYNGKGLNVNTWSLSNSSGSWAIGNQYMVSGSNGVYSLMILRKVYNSIGTFTFNVQADAGNVRYESASFNNIPFTIRGLTTTLTYIPATPEPYGNNVTIRVFYNVSDPGSVLYNGLGLNVNTWALSNATGPWTTGNQYVVSGSNGVYTLTILRKVYSGIGTSTFNIQANAGVGQYEPASFNNIPFSIRALTTALTYIPATPQPFGNNVTIRVFYNVSDPASILYNGLALSVNTWSLSNLSGAWTAGSQYTVTGASGIYDLKILSRVYSSIGTFYFNIQATPPNNRYSSASLNNVIFTIRALSTSLSIIPASPVPFGNNITGIRVFYNVSDPASALNGQGLDATFILSNASGAWSTNIQYRVTGSAGVFDFTVLRRVYSTVGSYSFNIIANPTGIIYSSATFNNIPFTIRALTTALTYIPSLPVPFGNGITIQVFINVSDPASILYNGVGLNVNTWSLSNVSGGWLSGREYTISGSNGAYSLTVLKNVYSAVGSYSFAISANMGNSIYQIATLSTVPFTIRTIITAITYSPVLSQPFGNNVTIRIYINVSDPTSIFNGQGVNAAWALSNASGAWAFGNQYVFTGTSGAYSFTVLNKVYNNIGTYSFNIVGTPSSSWYTSANFNGIPFSIRALTTTLTWVPPSTQPWGNPVNVTLFYNVSDPSSVLYNGMGLNAAGWTLSNTTRTWTASYEYVIFGANGAYRVTIDNDTVVGDVGTYQFNVYVTTGNIRYQSASITGIPFTIRPLTTRLTYTPVPNIPWGNNVTVIFKFNVSDAASLWYNNRAITGATLSVIRPSGWNFWTDFISYESAGAYTLEISNETVNIIQSYDIDVQASVISTKYEVSTIYGLPFTIRQLLTVMTYDPIKPVPYGNEVNISVHLRVSDPESDYYDGLSVLIDSFNILSPGLWNLSGNWTWVGDNGDYTITIFNNTRSDIGSYTIDLEAIPLYPVYSQASFYNIPYSIRKLNTLLIYPTPAKSPWGDNATAVTLKWQVIDSESIYHNNEIIIGGRIQVISPINWTYWRDYISKDLLNGNYLLNISKNIVNIVQTYVIDVKAFSLGSNIYANTTYIGLPFSVIQVFTSHTTIINSTYYLDAIGGWPWGDSVNVTVLFRDLDHSRLVANSNITVRGDSGSPYESGNFKINGLTRTIAGSQYGIFYLIINGTAAENAIGYNFYIILSHPTGYYLNHTYLFTISFRKSVSQIIPKNPPVFVPWGDNLTIIFTYNNSEAVGFPGIGEADVNVTVNNPAANAYFTYYAVPAWGPGAWIITMNTTWANATWIRQEEITFTMVAVAPGTIIAQSFHTVFITPLDSDVRTISWDAAIFLEQAKSFNITVELRDRSHFNQTAGNFNLIANNSYWTLTGSRGQYDNIQFIIATREGQFTNYTWYWGTVSVTVISLGVYRLTFFFNQTTYPPIQELLDYLVIIEVRGDHLDASQTQVQVDLKIQTHKTAMTFDWTYAENVLTPSFNLASFPSFINGSSYVYGDIITIYLYWYDKDSGALNPGISAAFISTNWTDPLYYRVFNMYQLFGQNESYRGIFFIQVDTKLFYDVVGTYTLEVNATLETYQRVYLLTHGYLFFEILPVPVNLTLQEPILSIPYHDNAEIKIQVTNIHEGNAGIFLSSSEIDIINIAGPMGGSKWLYGDNPLYGKYSLFFYTTAFDEGTYNATVMINKTNHEIVIVNFTFIIREINTQINLITPQNVSLIYRYSNMILFNYMDDIETYPYHRSIYKIPASPVDPLLSFNISDWYNINGKAITLKDEVAKGIYKININASIDVGVYQVSIFIKLLHYQLATYNMTINVTKARSEIVPVDPATIYSKFDVFQLLTKHFSIRYTTEFGETMLNATIYAEIRIGDISGALITRINLNREGNGIYGVELSTNNLTPSQTYTIVVYANPNDKNYAVTVLMYPNIFTVKPIWEHWLFIVGMAAIAAVAGVIAYRQIKWYLTPYQVKAIVRATKLIKKGKEQATLPVLMDRDELFRTEFADAWVALDLKPPKLMRPEVVLFASEISAILRSRMTTPEAESLVNSLKLLTATDAERQLGEMKIPPEATRRLLTIIGLIKKERADVKNFVQALSNIKGTEVPYAQAEEVFDHLQSLSIYEADKYLEALVIPEVDRKRLIELVGLKSAAAAKKPKELKEEKVKPKETPEKGPPEKVKDRPMNASELRAALDKIPELSPEERESLVKDLEKLSLNEQQQIMKNLRATKP